MHGNNTINFTLKAAPVVRDRSSIFLATIAVVGTLLKGTALLAFPREPALRISFVLHLMHRRFLNGLCRLYRKAWRPWPSCELHSTQSR